jgi:gamma-glutamyltranspeptidase/glutathione hydrolase
VSSPTPHGIGFPAYRPSVAGLNGMVASGHPLASQAGVRIMQAGGNAIDAAIAAAAAVGVVEPAMSGVGGDGFILIYDAATGRPHGVNATGPAPARATRERYLARGGIPMHGMPSVSVPGLVDGWLLAQRRFGKLDLGQVLAPAVDLCERGFPVSHKLAAGLETEYASLAADAAAQAVFSPRGRPLRAGELLVQRDLGTTLRRIAEQGRAAFYEGEIARRIGDASRAHGGVLDEDDLAAYHARWDEPIQVDYHGHRVYEMPPNSSGHVLLQALNLVERFDLAGMGCLSADGIHVMVEAIRLAFADRERYVSDPDWVDVPLDRLLSKAYSRQRAAAIDLARTTPGVGPGAPLRADSRATPPACAPPTAPATQYACCRASRPRSVPA